MPSFLSKVFGRKKDDKDSSPTNQLRPGELLGGKFEAISPNVSPTAAHFLELQSDTANLKVPVPDADSGRITNDEKEVGLSFFRIKSRPSSPEIKAKKLFGTLPPLSLDFDLKDKSAFNGYIFEESNSQAIFSDDVLGQRRLNPMEAIVLIRACSKAVVSRGLETLGIMTPHWYSASPDVQRRLISNFLRSLDLTTSSAAATPSSPYITSFEDEVNFTRSIHDVAAVLRWGLRHVQLEDDSFGTNDGWYKAFFDAEVANDYPPKAFSEKLAPNLPTSHLDLLTSTLEVFSSLAAFSEANSTSGSKLSKIFGLWLLTARRVEDKDDWRNFYARWERTGRMLEHLFLARIRNESTDQRLPTRLLELVHKYPFTHGLSPPTTDLPLLSYPQFTTAIHPALFVRVQYEVTSQERIPRAKINPSVLLADALSTKVEEGEFVDLWAKITTAASKTGSELPLGNVLANESLRLLSLVADKSKEGIKSPAFSVISLVEPQLQRASSNGAASLSPVKPSTESAPLTSAPLSPIGNDWEQFSASGFLDIDQSFPPLVSTLFDTDVEKTEPREIPLPISRKSSKRTGRKSLELPRSVVIVDSSGGSSPDATNPNSSKSRQGVITASQLEVIELDEAFVDFWSDSLLDPIASNWPAFVVCKFKPTLVPDLTFGTGDETTKKTLKWLVVEQVYSVKPRPIPISPLTALPTPAETSTRPASPIAQTPTGRRLFNFWSVSRTPSSSSTGSQKTKKIPKTPKVGEMGELIEEDDGKKGTIHVKLPSSKKFKSLDLPGKRSTGKKSHEKRSTDNDAEATSSSTIAAAGAAVAATTAAARLSTEKQEGDIFEVGLSTTPEVVAESSKLVLESESIDVAPKQVVVPEAESRLADVERAGIATILDVVPEQEVQIFDAGASAEAALSIIPGTTIVTDEQRTEEQTSEETGTTLEEDDSHHHQEVDQFFLVSADSASAEPRSDQRLSLEVESPVQQDGEVEQIVSIPSAIGEPDEPVLDEMTVVSEEPQAPLMTSEDDRVEIFEAIGRKLGGVSEKPEPEDGQEGPLELLTEAAEITVAAPTEPEIQVTELETNEDIRSGEVKTEGAITLPVAEDVETETSVPTLSVAESITIADGSIATGKSVELTEVIPSVGDTTEVSATVDGIEADGSFVGSVPAPGELSTVVEEVLPVAEPSGLVETTPILDDTSVPTQAAEEFPVGAGIAIPQTVLPLKVGGLPIVEESPLVATDFVEEAISERVTAGTSSDPAIDESKVPEAPSVEDREPVVDAPVQEATNELPTEPKTLEQLTTEQDIVEGSSAVEFGVEEFVAGSEAPVDEGATIVAEHSPVEVVVEKSADTEIPETQEAATDEVPASGSSPEEASDPARETYASEDIPPVESPLLETSSVAVESEELTLAEPTSEGSPEQLNISPEESPTEAVSVVEAESSQDLSVFEETPSQLGTLFVEAQPPTDEPHEELVVKITEELPATEPELPIEEPEATLLEAAPVEVPQVVDAINGVPFAKDATLAEGGVLDVPQGQDIASSEVSGAEETVMPTEGTPLEPAEELEMTLSTSEDAHIENIPSAGPHPVAEVTPPTEESLSDGQPATDEITVTSEEARSEEIPVGAGEGIGPVQSPENVAASVPEVSEESPPVEEAIPVAAEEPVEYVMSEPDVHSEAVAEASGLPDISEVVEGPEVDEVVNTDSINADPPTPVDEPTLPPDDLDKDSSVPIVETFNQPSLLDTSPVQDSLIAEGPMVATPAVIEETRTKEPPPDEPVNAEDNVAVEQPIPSLPSAEVKISSLDDDFVSVPQEKSPVIAEVTSEAVRTVPDTVEEDSVPADGMSAAIPDDADQPKPIVADEVLGSVEANPEIGLQPHTETHVEPRESSSDASEQPAERGDNISANPVAEIPEDIDQPIHSQEAGHTEVEGGIIVEPIIESAGRDDLTIEKFDDQRTLDPPIASSTTDSIEFPDEKGAHIDNQNKPADVIANTLDPTIAGTTSISKTPVETPSENSRPSLFDPSSVMEPEIVPDLLAEPSPESGNPPMGQPADEFPAYPEHVVPIGSAIPDEVHEFPTSVEESRDVAESSEEPATVLLEEPESASELPNGVSDDQSAVEVIETPLDDDVDVKAVADGTAILSLGPTTESAASEPDTAVEKLEDATDVEATVDPIPTAEAQ